MKEAPNKGIKLNSVNSNNLVVKESLLANELLAPHGLTGRTMFVTGGIGYPWRANCILHPELGTNPQEVMP